MSYSLSLVGGGEVKEPILYFFLRLNLRNYPCSLNSRKTPLRRLPNFATSRHFSLDGEVKRIFVRPLAKFENFALHTFRSGIKSAQNLNHKFLELEYFGPLFFVSRPCFASAGGLLTRGKRHHEESVYEKRVTKSKW